MNPGSLPVTGRRWILSSRLALICRLALGATFLIAGLTKVGRPGELLQTVLSFQVLLEFLARPFALTLPWLEIICGSFLIAGLLLGSASALLAVLNLAFLVAIGVNLWRGATIECGCFGQPEELSWKTFARDVGFLLLSLQILFAKPGRLSLDWALQAIWRRARPGA